MAFDSDFELNGAEFNSVRCQYSQSPLGQLFIQFGRQQRGWSSQREVCSFHLTYDS